jgi:hypothetical protein
VSVRNSRGGKTVRKGIPVKETVNTEIPGGGETVRKDIPVREKEKKQSARIFQCKKIVRKDNPVRKKNNQQGTISVPRNSQYRNSSETI